MKMDRLLTLFQYFKRIKHIRVFLNKKINGKIIQFKDKDGEVYPKTKNRIDILYESNIGDKNVTLNKGINDYGQIRSGYLSVEILE